MVFRKGSRTSYPTGAGNSYGGTRLTKDEEEAALFVSASEKFAPIGSVTPIQVVRSSGNFPISQTTEWTDLDPGGSGFARPLDIVLPGMKVGDHFEFRVANLNLTTGAYFLGTVFVIKGGVAHRNLSSSLYGYSPWSKVNSTAGDLIPVSGPRFTVKEGDLESDGSIRLRFRYQLTTGTRNVTAVPDVPVIFEGRGPLA